MRPDPQTAVLADFAFEGGACLDVAIGYWTLGGLDADRRNAILVCHGASGNRDWALPFCRADGAFDPARWFVVSIDLPGGGASSRASRDEDFPADYTVGDLARMAAALARALGLTRLAAFSGASLASLIGVELAATFPELVGALALWNCGVRCDGYAQAVVGAVGACIGLAPGEPGIRAAAAAFLPAALGRDALAGLDQDARNDLVDGLAANWAANWRSDELASRYRCVGGGDLPARYGGEAALAALVRCPTLWLPSSSDAVLPAADALRFAGRLRDAEVEVCLTDRGHVSTGAPEGSAEFMFYDGRTARFLAGLPA